MYIFGVKVCYYCIVGYDNTIVVWYRYSISKFIIGGGELNEK